MKARVLLNVGAGLRPRPQAAEGARVRDLLQAAGLAAEVSEVPGPALQESARAAAAAGAGLVVMGGGDGTVSAGAGALAGTGTPMGVLPLGTLNHFARDLGIPTDLEAAARVLVEGVVREVDVGEAGERVFVNNSSIGLYPAAVSLRDAWIDARGMHKWVAMARAGLRTLRWFPVMKLTIRTPEGGRRLTTPMVFVGNNRYETRLLALGTRARLDGGELWVCLARESGRLGLARFVLRALLGRLDEGRDFEGLGLQELLVEDRRRVLEVAFDGEVCHVSPPLRYRIRPRALRVMVPRA